MSLHDKAIPDAEPERFCVFCLKHTTHGVWFINHRNTEPDEDPPFKYMEENQASHIECYIHECVRRALNELR